MKKLSIITIPVIVVILLLAGVFAWKVMTPTRSVVITQTETLPNSVQNAGGTKPTNPFGFLFGSGVTPISTPTPETVAAMNTELNALDDDGGTADINSLKSDAGGL